jgi:DNA repair exonuclease SbcCD ATPase subunit
LVLKELYLRNFKGIKEKELTFKEGVNIFFGPNEAGKSSLIQAIVLCLFGDASSKKAGLKNYFYKLEHPSYLKLKFSLNDEDYIIERDFVNRQQTLSLPSGEKLKHKDEITSTILKKLGMAFSPEISKSLQSRFEDLFIIHQEKVEINEPKDIANLLLDAALKSLPVKPAQAKKKLEKYQEDLDKGLTRPTKEKGKIATLIEKKQKLQERIKELEQNLEEFKYDLKALQNSRQEHSKLITQVKELETLETSLKRMKELALKANSKREELERLEALRIINEVKEGLKNSLSSYHLLSLIYSVFTKLEQFREKNERLLKEIAKLEELKEERKQIKDQLGNFPTSLDSNLRIVERLEQLKSQTAELLRLEKELQENHPDLLNDLKQAFQLTPEETTTKPEFKAKAKLEIDAKALQRTSILVDKEAAQPEPVMEFDFINSLAIEHPELKAVLTLESGAQEERKEKEEKLKAIFAKHNVNSISELEAKAGRFSSLKQLAEHQQEKIKQTIAEIKVEGLKLTFEEEIKKGGQYLLDFVNNQIEALLNKQGVKSFSELKEKLDQKLWLERELQKIENEIEKLEKATGKTNVSQIYDFLTRARESFEDIVRRIDPVALHKFNELVKLFNLESELPKLPLNKMTNPQEAAFLAQQMDLSENELEIIESVMSSALKDQIADNLNVFHESLFQCLKKMNEVRKSFSESEVRSLIEAFQDILELEKNLKDELKKYRKVTLDLTSEMEAFKDLYQEIKTLDDDSNRMLRAIIEMIEQGLPEDYEKFIKDLEPAMKKIENVLESNRRMLNELEKEIVRLEQKTSSVPDQTEIQNLKDNLEAIEIRIEKAMLTSIALRIAIESFEPALNSFAANVLKKAEKEASKVFSRITENRYSTIELLPDDSGNLILNTHQHEIDFTFAPELLSRGTLDQLYMALRLGFSLQLLKDVQFPFFFDETFADFDDQRLQNAFEVLIEFLKEGKIKQLFITTCQERVFENLKLAAQKYGLTINPILL